MDILNTAWSVKPSPYLKSDWDGFKAEFKDIEAWFDRLDRDLSHYTSRNDICTPLGCVKEVIAPWVINTPMNKRLFEIYIKTQLPPCLKPKSIVILDNLSSHKSEYLY